MTPKKVVRKLTQKVPKVEPQVKVIYLHCPNCGEEDEKVIYCSQCDSPMDVVKVESRQEDDVVVDTSVSKDEAGTVPEDELVAKSSVASEELGDPVVDRMVEDGGFNLGDIYSDGDETGFSADSMGDEDSSLDEVLTALDDE